MAKRLSKEYYLMENNDEEERFFIESKSSDLEWIMKIIIENEECCYNGGAFTVKLNFSSQYPFKPPIITFYPPIYHPSINQDTGEICADMIKNRWSPGRDVSWIMSILYTMFVTNNIDGIVDSNIMNERENNYEKFKEKVQKQIEKL